MHLLPLAVTSLGSLAAAQARWRTPALESTLNSAYADVSPFLTADGKTVYFSTRMYNPNSINYDIYSSTRAQRGQPWSTPVGVSGINDPVGQEDQPCVSADGLEIYFSSSRAGGMGGSDIMRAIRPSSSSPWGAPVFVTELNSFRNDTGPSLTGNGLTMYFLSGSGIAQIFMSTRPNRTSPWTTPVPVTEFAASFNHPDVDISANGNEILFTRDRYTVVDLMVARRAKPSGPFTPPITLTDFAGLGNAGWGAYQMALSQDRTEALITVQYGVSSGDLQILSTRLTGLGQSGLCTSTSDLVLTFRDPAAPLMPYVGAFALGDTGFPLGTRTVPLDPDAVFVNLFGGVPPVTTAYTGVLDGNGEATARVRTLFPFLIGIKLYTGFFSIDYSQPFGVRTISNSLPFEFLP